MNVSIEEKKAEAIRRMKALGIFGETIKQFKDEDLISQSEAPFGACYWLSDAQLERVHEFEKKHNAVVYHVIHSFVETSYGEKMEMESMLYVSDYKDEWEDDRDGIKSGDVLANVYNCTYPDATEIGYIGVRRTVAAGLARTY